MPPNAALFSAFRRAFPEKGWARTSRGSGLTGTGSAAYRSLSHSAAPSLRGGAVAGGWDRRP
eukprot:3096994-Lingulodinium_polyedra.AAC.1